MFRGAGLTFEVPEHFFTETQRDTLLKFMGDSRFNDTVNFSYFLSRVLMSLAAALPYKVCL